MDKHWPLAKLQSNIIFDKSWESYIGFLIPKPMNNFLLYWEIKKNKSCIMIRQLGPFHYINKYRAIVESVGGGIINTQWTIPQDTWVSFITCYSYFITSKVRYANLCLILQSSYESISRTIPINLSPI